MADSYWIPDNNFHSTQQVGRKRLLTDSSSSPQRDAKEFRQSDIETTMDLHGSANNKVRLHISNIPYEMKWQELKDLLREKVNADVFVEIFNGSDGRPSGVGYIEVKTQDLAKKTIEVMHRSDIRGRQIIVREVGESTEKLAAEKMKLSKRPVTENEEDVIRRMQMSSGGGSMGSGLAGARPPGMLPQGSHNMQPGAMGPLPSLSNDFSLQLINDLGIDPANITNQVFVANLDYKVTVEMLEEVFRIAGNVLAVELKVDKDSKFRGMATVRFEHPMESVQAISLFNGQRFQGRNMSVRMDRWNDPKPQIVPKMLPLGLESIGVGLGIGGRPLYNLGQISNTLTLANLGGFLRNNRVSGNIVGSNGTAQSHRGYVMNQPAVSSNAGDNGGGIGNLEAIIAATIRAVTGQMGSLGSPTDGVGPVMRNSTNMGVMDGGLVAGYGAAGVHGIGNRWHGSSPMSVTGSQTAVAGDGDPNTLYVGNLPFSCTWQSLKDRFKEVGDVLFADIKMENGRSAGCGTVRMRNPEDAAIAIARLNGCNFDGRQIDVRWLKKSPTSLGLGKPHF